MEPIVYETTWTFGLASTRCSVTAAVLQALQTITTAGAGATVAIGLAGREGPAGAEDPSARTTRELSAKNLVTRRFGFMGSLRLRMEGLKESGWMGGVRGV